MEHVGRDSGPREDSGGRKRRGKRAVSWEGWCLSWAKGQVGGQKERAPPGFCLMLREPAEYRLIFLGTAPPLSESPSRSAGLSRKSYCVSSEVKEL